jgi:hypothetical protein
VLLPEDRGWLPKHVGVKRLYFIYIFCMSKLFVFNAKHITLHGMNNIKILTQSLQVDTEGGRDVYHGNIEWSKTLSFRIFVTCLKQLPQSIKTYFPCYWFTEPKFDDDKGISPRLGLYGRKKAMPVMTSWLPPCNLGTCHWHVQLIVW